MAYRANQIIDARFAFATSEAATHLPGQPSQAVGAGGHEFGDVPGPRVPSAPNAGRGTPDRALDALGLGGAVALVAPEPAVDVLAPTLGALPLDASVAGTVAEAEMGLELAYVDPSDALAGVLALDRAVNPAATAGAVLTAFGLDRVPVGRRTRAGCPLAASVRPTACLLTDSMASTCASAFNRSSGPLLAAEPEAAASRAARIPCTVRIPAPSATPATTNNVSTTGRVSAIPGRRPSASPARCGRK